MHKNKKGSVKNIKSINKYGIIFFHARIQKRFEKIIIKVLRWNLSIKK